MKIDRNAALLVIDVQQAFDLERWGRRNNPEMEANGLALLAAWRRTGRPVFVIRHDSRTPGSPLHPGSPTNALKTGFEPLPGEPLITKKVNSAFIGTDLADRLRADDIGQVLVFGICTDMCVSTTARMAANLGFRTVIAGDACHTFDQTAPDGTPMPAEQLHMAHLTTLNSEFGTVANTAEILDVL